MDHANGSTVFTFGAPRRTGGAAPAFDGAALTCASTYCHGATLARGRHEPHARPGRAAPARRPAAPATARRRRPRTPPAPSCGGCHAGYTATTVNAALHVDGKLDVTAQTCGACHGIPPPAPHTASTTCGTCHPGYTATTVDPVLHIDGKVDVANLGCTSCHGKAGQTATAAAPLLAAPPVDASGAATGIRVGAHQKHLVGGTYSSGYPCATCHAAVGSYAAGHSDGVRQVGFTGAANTNLRKGSFTPGTGTAAGTCGSTFCHGAVMSKSGGTVGGTLTRPSWTNTITACSACHTVSASSLPGRHSRHSSYACSECHGAGYSSSAVNKTLHVNGVKNVSGSRITSWNGTSCTVTCHGSETLVRGMTMDRSIPNATPRDTTMTAHASKAARRAAAPLLLLALLAACGQERKPEAAAPPSVRGAHAALTGDPACAGTTPHDVHVALFRCDACHPTGATFGFDVPFTFAGGTTTAGGTLVRDADRHHLHRRLPLPEGRAAAVVSWTTPGPLACTDLPRGLGAPAGPPAGRRQRDARRLPGLPPHEWPHSTARSPIRGHARPGSDRASAGFHALVARTRGSSSCRGCHGQDLAGGRGATACARCHDLTLPAGVASWKVNCVMCHGGVELASGGAPPKATWGNGADAVRVGAHAVHLTASAIAPAAECSACHSVPADVFTPGHLDGGTAEVVFARVRPGRPRRRWDRATATCASTYCHGAGLAGGSEDRAGLDARRRWARPPAAPATACRPPSPHPTVAREPHRLRRVPRPSPSTPTGAMIPPAQGGKHLDGAVEATGGHPAAWMDPASPEFHAFTANRGPRHLPGCHGAALDGVGGSTTVVLRDLPRPPAGRAAARCATAASPTRPARRPRRPGATPAIRSASARTRST